MKYFGMILLLLSFLGISGCGQTGKLYLPKQEQAQVNQQHTQMVQDNAKKG